MKTRLFVLTAALLMLAISAMPQVSNPGKQDSHPGTAQPSKPPAISYALKKDFFKAQMQLRDAQAAFQRAQQASVAASDAITKACGDAFTATLDGSQEPVCVVKPDPKK
jgi:RecA-family ATPase